MTNFCIAQALKIFIERRSTSFHGIYISTIFSRQHDGKAVKRRKLQYETNRPKN